MEPIESIPIFIGYDYRERAATNVLIDSLYQHSSKSLAITPLVTKQLEAQDLYWREKDPRQSTEFTFTRFLVPYLMKFKGWAIFMDCDMLCLDDINKLWEMRNDKYSLMCVHHDQKINASSKFLGEIQTRYPKKNWSSLMLMNCERCKELSLDYVNTASAMELHQFLWLSDEKEIGELDHKKWNLLIEDEESNDNNDKAKLVHWTLGGPWFKEKRVKEGPFYYDWFLARENAMKLWD